MNLKKFKTKPEIVEAIQYDGSEEMARELEQLSIWINAEYDEGGFIGVKLDDIYVDENYWIIVAGDTVDACHEASFDLFYEEI